MGRHSLGVTLRAVNDTANFAKIHDNRVEIDLTQMMQQSVGSGSFKSTLMQIVGICLKVRWRNLMICPYSDLAPVLRFEY